MCDNLVKQAGLTLGFTKLINVIQDAHDFRNF
jgi:hypothetical protein